jgi:squalene-hopene/tetraprenyl-beta-curcumene cyclase
VRQGPMSRSIICVVAASVLATAVAVIPVRSAAAPDKAVISQAERAIDNGLRWLRSVQKSDGTFGGHLGITELAVMAFALSHRQYREDDGPFMRRPIEKIRAAAKPDGSITEGSGNESTKNYTTALGLLALKSNGDPKDNAIIQAAQQWLKMQQTVEAQGYQPEDKFYGGFGYGSSLRPDLSNTHFAIEALRTTGIPASDPVFARAVKFLQRTQNRTESNDVPGALDDGGFAYFPGFSFEGGWTSTGSMTYGGLKSYIYADIDRKDPRVQAALKWITKNYTLEEHPGRGPKTYYYYVHVFARTWNLLKVNTVDTEDGVKHDWVRELVQKLVSEQRPQGYWVNGRASDEWEDRPELCTSHALLAMIYGLQAYKN